MLASTCLYSLYAQFYFFSQSFFGNYYCGLIYRVHFLKHGVYETYLSPRLNSLYFWGMLLLYAERSAEKSIHNIILSSSHSALRRHLLSIAVIARKPANDRTGSSYLMSSLNRNSSWCLLLPLPFIRSVTPQRLMTVDQRRFPALRWVAPGVRPSYVIRGMEEKARSDCWLVRGPRRQFYAWPSTPPTPPCYWSAPRWRHSGWHSSDICCRQDTDTWHNAEIRLDIFWWHVQSKG